MGLGKEIKRLRENAGVSAETLASYLKVGVDKLRKWEQRDSTPKAVDRARIEHYFDRPWQELDKLDKFDFQPPRPDDQLQFEDPEAEYGEDENDGEMRQALYKLVEANQLLAKSHFNFSESNKTLAENNKELITMLKSNGHLTIENPEVFDARLRKILVVISEVASGERKYRSSEDAYAAMHTRLFGTPKETVSSGTQ